LDTAFGQGASSFGSGAFGDSTGAGTFGESTFHRPESAVKPEINSIIGSLDENTDEPTDEPVTKPTTEPVVELIDEPVQSSPERPNIPTQKVIQQPVRQVQQSVQQVQQTYQTVQQVVSPQPGMTRQPGVPSQHGFVKQSQSRNQAGFTNNPEARTKIGGFLLLIAVASIIWIIFDIIMSFLLILGTNIMISVSIEEVYSHLLTSLYMTLIAEIIGLPTIVFNIMFISRLFKRKPNFLRYAQISMLITIVYIVLLGIGFSNMLLWMDEFIVFIIAAVLVLIYLILFTRYMCKSKRVREYMGSEEYLRKALFAFKDKYNR